MGRIAVPRYVMVFALVIILTLSLIIASGRQMRPEVLQQHFEENSLIIPSDTVRFL